MKIIIPVLVALLIYLAMIVEIEHKTFAEIKTHALGMGQHAEQVEVESWTIKFNWTLER